MSRPRIAGLAGRTPLRIKLVAALISLLVLGLATTGAASWFALHSYLVGRVDQSLVSSSVRCPAPTSRRMTRPATSFPSAASGRSGRPGRPRGPG
jgi:hypothetical protein